MTSAPDRLESDREAIYRRLYAVWPEWRTAEDLVVERGQTPTFAIASGPILRDDLHCLHRAGRLDRAPEDYSGRGVGSGKYRVRMGAA